MRKSLLYSLQKLDQFGQPVQLYYNDGQAQKKSLLGLLVTCVMMVTALGYVTNLAVKVGNTEH